MCWATGLLTGLTALLFNVQLADMLSGYRVLSRRFVKSFPFTAEGFGIETELTVHAVRLMMPMVGDGHALQGTAGGLGLQAQHLARRLPHPVHHRLSGARGTAAGVLHLLLRGPGRGRRCSIGTPVVTEYLQTGLVPRLPTAVLATGLMLLAFLSLTCGLILDTVTRGRWEAEAHGLSRHSRPARPP